MGLPERLKEVQALMAKGDERAAKIYETIGVYLGYTIPHYADFYDFRHMLILGRVTTARAATSSSPRRAKCCNGVSRTGAARSPSTCPTRRAGASARRWRPPVCRKSKK